MFHLFLEYLFFSDLLRLLCLCQDLLHNLFIEYFGTPCLLGLGIDGDHDDYALLRREAKFYKFLSLHEGDSFPLIKATFNEEFDPISG